MRHMTLLEARRGARTGKRADYGLTLQELSDATRPLMAPHRPISIATLSRLERRTSLPLHVTVLVLEDALGLKRGTLVFPQESRTAAA